MRNKIYLSSPHMCGEEMKYIKMAFDSNWIAPLGENVTEFENEINKHIGSVSSLALSSGTAAIHLGLKYLGVGEGDIVFCSSFTFAGSCNPIRYLNAIPVFIDSDYETLNMSPKALKKAYEKYPNPKAVILVNLYGNPCNFDELLKITNKHNTPVLEDAAESLGSKYKGVQTGTFGDIGVFSFNGNKIITTSGGGMAVLKDDAARSKMLSWATQSKMNLPWYQHEEIGYNYRLSNICAGIGRGQLSALKDRIKKKKKIYERYKRAFDELIEISMIPITESSEPNHWLSGIIIDSNSSIKVTDILQKLADVNVECRMVWKPMHLQPIFCKYDFFSHNDKGLSVSEDIFNRGICLPSDTKMTEEEQDFVIKKIKEIFAKT